MPWIDKLFHHMCQQGASDLHLTSGVAPRYRLHGDMVPVDGAPEIPAEKLSQILHEILPERNRAEFEETWDTDFAYEIEGLARFRANYFMDRLGPGAVFRVIPSEILSFSQLGLPPVIERFTELSKGLVLVTGPTGSGKSTTLAAMIDRLNDRRSDHLITIEDPVEFVHPQKKCLVNQREVGRHTKSFKSALRAALREDPDIILVGELRDLETIEIALETAETGHLVFGTLHTSTAASTVDRIIDQFPAGRQAQIRTMLAGSLKGVVSQTLCKKQPKGRVAALEILVLNNAISSQIREGKTYQISNSMQTGGKQGMRLLNDSLAELVAKGDVAPAEAYLKAIDKEGLLQRMASEGVRFDPENPEGASSHPPSFGVEGARPAAPLPAAREQEAPPEAGSPSGDPFEQFKRNKQG